jgi:DNA adenine methylase/adenine-specific DNA-methyltransferase
MAITAPSFFRQETLLPSRDSTTFFPEDAKSFPRIRFMGSKARLLPWIHEALGGLKFETALDAFSGAGSVSYLLKAMGKQVTANDFLHFPTVFSQALIANNSTRITPDCRDFLLTHSPHRKRFIETTFQGIFYTPQDLRFLDRVSWNLREVAIPNMRALALSALMRACVKRQPRGVFTIAGDPEKHKDGRRDLALSLQEHFLEQIDVYNEAVFDNNKMNSSSHGNIFDVTPGFDLVYMDPPYVPRSDDNCYMKRYHFLEGLSCYWEHQEILTNTRVKKIKKPYTPFSYRKDCIAAFESLFRKFRNSILVLSYSSNGYPDLEILTGLMGKYKKDIEVLEKDHRYHFGTHKAVKRSEVKEYLILGI